MITGGDYGYAVALDNTALKATVDEVIAEVRADGTQDQMIARWLPAIGNLSPMPSLALEGGNGVLRFGTAALASRRSEPSTKCPPPTPCVTLAGRTGRD